MSAQLLLLRLYSIFLSYHLQIVGPYSFHIEWNIVVPEVKIPFIFSIEVLIASHYVVTIQSILTTRRYIVKLWYMLLLKPQVKEGSI